MTTPFRLLIFGLVCVVSVFLFSLVVNRGFKKININTALLYISSVAMIGVLGEIFVDTIYNYLFGTPLWRYNFLPIHNAYTSQFSPILWGAFGLYLYLIHPSYEKWSRRQLIYLAFIFSLEAIVIEAIADIVSRPILGELIYYYYPSNLWHISALQNIPFYFLSGLLIVVALYKFKSSPRFFAVLSAWITIIIIFFV